MWTGIVHDELSVWAQTDPLYVYDLSLGFEVKAQNFNYYILSGVCPYVI